MRVEPPESESSTAQKFFDKNTDSCFTADIILRELERRGLDSRTSYTFVLEGEGFFLTR